MKEPEQNNVLLDEILWRLKDIREDLISTGIAGRCYNMDEWSTPVVNIDALIKLIASNKKLYCGESNIE